MSHQSPWLHQIKTREAHPGPVQDHERDVVIVGAGISGVMTAYFALQHTRDTHITILEADRIAHGATGHNAGQLVAEFELTFTEIAEKFGTEQAVDAQQDIERAWTLLENIHRDEELTTPMSTFTGYAGYESLESIENILKNQNARSVAGLEPRKVYLLDSLATNTRFIPYRHLYDLVPLETIQNLLETKTVHYHAVMARKRGCMNSALFSEELIHILKERYPERLIVHEHSPVETIHLHQNNVTLSVRNIHASTAHAIIASRVILCTNGFENIKLVCEHNPTFDTKFHESVKGLVGSMAGYLEVEGEKPTALSYHELSGVLATKESGFDERAYFYFTRRPFEIDNGKHSLVCVGGPQVVMDDTRHYNPQAPFNETHKDVLDSFMKITYRGWGGLRHRFLWHGLMGYTPTGMRIIGPDKHEKVLWYNLGCNGIGLMTAVFGGYKIARMLNGESFPASVFDPR